MRNNQERFSPFQQQQNQSVSNPVAQVAQPVFSFVVPTELVELPSMGAFYPPEHPLHNKPTIEIKHMTAREEDILSNKSYMEKGIILDKLLESVFIDKSIDPLSLLLIDKNAILLKTRITGYGNEYASIVSCGTCGFKNETSVNLDNLLSIKQGVLPENAEAHSNGLVTVELPVSKWKVTIKPLNGYDQVAMQKAFEARKKHNLEENILLETLKSFIVSINGLSDIGTLQAGIMNMPARDSKYLRTVFQTCFPSINTDVSVECKSCNSTVRTEVQFSLNFFWPD